MVKKTSEASRRTGASARIVKIITTLGTVILLGGCAGVNSQFDCHKVGGLGAGCVSLDHVNKMADAGDFNHPVSNKTQSIQTALNNDDQYTLKHQLNQAGVPVRTGESVHRIWVAPFVDTAGNYHASSTVYTVTHASHWIGEPVKAIRRSGAQLS
jgi:conjugal transfer pilus assembly protein TraV